MHIYIYIYTDIYANMYVILCLKNTTHTSEGILYWMDMVNTGVCIDNISLIVDRKRPTAYLPSSNSNSNSNNNDNAATIIMIIETATACILKCASKD